MRAAFIRALITLAEGDPRVALLTGDLGFMVVEPFIDQFPDRFWNVGVAEQNMVGIATGLAEAGYVPFVYSIASFAVLRPYEFIRNGPIAHRLPVRVVGAGGGFEYGLAGPTHHAIEDVAVLRPHPGIAVFTPADHRQADAAVAATAVVDGPVYLRIGKDDHRSVPGLGAQFGLGRAHTVRDGPDVAVVAMGAIATEAVSAADALAAADGIESTVVVVSCINPPPISDLVDVLARHDRVMTVEAHSTTGGLGSLVCEIVAERRLGCQVVRCGIAEISDPHGGSEAYLNDRHGISARALAETARRIVAIPLVRREPVARG
jgi:transketolase